MIIKYFAWLKNITEIEEELISDTNISIFNRGTNLFVYNFGV